MKYHVNPTSGKVSPCRARVKCRFGGASGSENHFASKEKAEAASEKLMTALHPQASVKKASPAFAATRANIQRGLVESGVIPNASALPPVNSKSEMIEKWFNGDRHKFEVIAKISDPKSSLKAETRQSVGRFMSSGMDVTLAKDSSFKKAPSALSSEVELIDDLDPEDMVSFEDIMSGRRKAF